MFEIVLTVAPIFILIAIGYAAVQFGYLKVDIADQLNAFAIKLAVPVLLMRAMANLDFAQAFSPPLLLGFYTGALTCFALGIVIAQRVFKRTPGEAVAFGFAATFSNSLLLGVPIIERAVGGQTLEMAFGIIAFHAPLLYTVGMITMEMMRRDGRPLGQTLQTAIRSIAANPLMIGILTGLAINASGIALPEPIDAPLAMLGGSAIPAALVGIGAALTRYQLRAALPETLSVAGLSLIVHPAIVFALTHFVFGLPPVAVYAAVMMAAMPPGVNIYVFAAMYDRAVSLAASALLLSTALAVISVSLWLYILGAVLG